MAHRSMTTSRGTYASELISCAIAPAQKSRATVPPPIVFLLISTPAMYIPRAGGVVAALNRPPL